MGREDCKRRSTPRTGKTAGFQPLSGEAIHSPYGTLAGKHRTYYNAGKFPYSQATGLR